MHTFTALDSTFNINFVNGANGKDNPKVSAILVELLPTAAQQVAATKLAEEEAAFKEAEKARLAIEAEEVARIKPEAEEVRRI